MPIYDGTQQIHQMFITDAVGTATQIHVARIGRTAVFPDSLGNSAPVSNIVTSSVGGSANHNQDVTFTATVIDDDLTEGTYAWYRNNTLNTADGTSLGTFIHPQNIVTSGLEAGVTNTYQCLFTDAGGEQLWSNVFSQTWLADPTGGTGQIFNRDTLTLSTGTEDTSAPGRQINWSFAGGGGATLRYNGFTPLDPVPGGFTDGFSIGASTGMGSGDFGGTGPTTSPHTYFTGGNIGNVRTLGVNVGNTFRGSCSITISVAATATTGPASDTITITWV